MAQNVGTYDISTLLAVRNQSATEFGLNTIQQVLQADVAAHNVLVNQMLSEMAEFTTDKQRIYGSSTSGEMIEVDEYGRAPSQIVAPGATVAFPLRLFQFVLGWTAKWLEIKTPADMAQGVLDSEQAHLRNIRKELKKAIYLSANYDFVDFLDDKVTLAVKRLVNADSAPIPNGPNSETFDGATHTHYNGYASLTADNMKANIRDVVEHGHGGTVRVAISNTDETAVRALTGFTAYVDPRIVYRNTDAPGVTLDITRLDNRPIGIFDSAEIWVKPWAIASYQFAWDASSPNKPIAVRQRSQVTLQGLRIVAENSSHPLSAQFMEAEYGMGIWTRTNGAVGYFANATYADPTITS